MNKYIYRASFGLLALGLGGCASLPFMGGGQSPSPTASASPTTTATNVASPTTSPTASASPGTKSPAPNDPKASPSTSPNAKKTPLPTPSTQASTAPGIILSTNPEERLLANNKVGGRANKVERNPFSNIPSIPLPGLSESSKNLGKKEDETPQLPKTESQQVQSPPPLTISTPPPQLLGQTTTQQLSTSSIQNIPGLPPITPKYLPQLVVTQPVRAVKPVVTPAQTTPGKPSITPAQTTPGKPVVTPAQTTPGKPSITPTARTTSGKPGVAPVPTTQIALLPAPSSNIPSLPTLERKNIPQWEDPNQPPPGVAVAPQAPPPPPDTSIAENIEVSGIVKVGTQKQIIVKVPTEATSRYVKEGQKLANGEVLVKIIDINDQEPSVTFVQNGVDVVRQVGEKPIGAEEEKVNNFNS